ncbi:MAG TPA: hypothetical protein VM077_01160 [Candidatus Limnocylindrales bacterium]|nr:hypothetical protein [Candidatus Limnocylindrales bacterium]
MDLSIDAYGAEVEDGFLIIVTPTTPARITAAIKTSTKAEKPMDNSFFTISER